MHNPTACLLAALLFISSGCSGPEGHKEPEDALDAAREFVRAVLDGDYARAELHLLDEDDKVIFGRYKQFRNARPDTERRQLKSATIIINSVEAQSDSVTMVNYANSLSREPTELRVVKRNGRWLVDFSHTFESQEKR
jgi:hypothetical protein